MSKNAIQEMVRMNKRLIATLATVLLLIPLIPMVMAPEAHALPTPSVFYVEGKAWYRWDKSGATQAVIVLYGGTASCWNNMQSGSATSQSYDSKPANERAWVEELWNFGFAVVSNKDHVTYTCAGTSISTCSTWPHTLRNTVRGWYSRVEFFGHSAGGLTVASEIIRYADYPAASFVSSPVNWDSFCNAFLFQSAHSAASDKLHTRLEYGTSDPYGIAAQMDLYRQNAYYGSGKVIMWDYISGNMHDAFFQPGPGDVYRAYVKTFLWQYG